MIIIVVVAMIGTMLYSTFSNVMNTDVNHRKHNQFNVDKDLFYNNLYEALQSASTVDVVQNPKEILDEEGNFIATQELSMITVHERYTAEDGEYIKTQSFEDRGDEVVYTSLTNKVGKGAGDEATLEAVKSYSLIYPSLSEMKATLVDTVCTDETLNTGCVPVTNLIDVSVFSDRLTEDSLFNLRSRRLVHYD